MHAQFRHPPARDVVSALVTKVAKISEASASLWLVAALTALMIAPVVIFDMPAMNDYPNHLARMYLLADRGTDLQNPYYFVPFAISPNLAMDIVVTALSRFLDVATATKTFLILSQLLIVSGAVALEIAVKGRHQFAGFAAAAMLYSLPFAWGFLNFEFGTGLALWGLASWRHFKDGGPATRFALHSGFSALLFLSHLMAFALYGAALGFMTIAEFLSAKLGLGQAARRIAFLATPAIVIVALALRFGGPKLAGVTEWSAKLKIVTLLSALDSYSPMLSVYATFALAAAVGYMLAQRQLIVTQEGKWTAMEFLILVAILPSTLLGGGLTDIRVAIGAVLILPALLTVSSSPQFASAIPTIFFTALALANATQTASQWRTMQPQFEALHDSFGQIARGGFILVGYSKDRPPGRVDTDMPIAQGAVLSAHFADAFVPTLFTIPGQQPLQVCPQLKRLALGGMLDYVPVAYSILAAVANGAPLPDTPAHVRDWTHDYDYLYLVGPQSDNPMPDRLRLLTQADSFALYAVIKLPTETGQAHIRAGRSASGDMGRAECDLHP